MSKFEVDLIQKFRKENYGKLSQREKAISRLRSVRPCHEFNIYVLVVESPYWINFLAHGEMYRYAYDYYNHVNVISHNLEEAKKLALDRIKYLTVIDEEDIIFCPYSVHCNRSSGV